MDEQPKVRLVEVDSRGRASIGQFTNGHEFYLGSVDENGVITLEPAAVVPELQRKLMARPDIMALIDGMSTGATKSNRKGLPKRTVAS